MDFINQHLESNPSLDEIAEAASFSKFHFHRLFRALVGETVAEYMRRLRLEKAARMLIFNHSEDITSIALACGFSSSQNFAKAFRKYFQQSPSEFRRSQQNHNSKPGNNPSNTRNVAAWPGLYSIDAATIAALSQRSQTMNVEVKTMPAFHVAYVRHLGPYGTNGIEAAYNKLLQWAGPRSLAESGQMIGIAWDNPEVTPADKCRYDACITVPEQTKTQDEIGLQKIPEGTYAVYHCEVHNNNFTKPWNEFFGDWLPGSGYQPDDKPCYELYHNDAAEDPDRKWDNRYLAYR